MSLPNEVTSALLGGSAAASDPYQISRSLRFNSPDSAYLSRTPSSSGNKKTCTMSAWVKRSKLGAIQMVFTSRGPGNPTAGPRDSLFQLDSNDVASISFADGAYALTTTQVFRDLSAWYHIVVAVDTTQATSTNRIKLYVNGSQVTTFSSSSYPDQNYEFSSWNVGSQIQYIGCDEYINRRYFFDGYLADIHFIDGQALDPTSFGEFDTNGVWQPIDASGLTFGTNGFHLPFSDNSTAAALGTDTSGNGNTWTVNNISVTAGAGNDSLVDTPTNGSQTDTGVGGEVVGNYATLNPLANKLQNANTTVTLSNGNLDIVGASNTSSSCAGTFGVSSGKWYFEYTVVSQAETNDTFGFGIRRDLFTGTYDNWEPYFRGTRLRASDNGFYVAESGGSFLTATPNGAVIGMAFDIDTNYCAVYVNGSIRLSSSSAGLSGYTWFPYVAGDGGGAVTANFGQRAFAYTAPSGFKALCTTNLPEPTIADGSTAMDVALYTGNGSTQTISGLNFSPDLVWMKMRSTAGYSHKLVDTVRGATISLVTNNTNAELTETSGLTAFTSNGFSLGSQDPYNRNSDTFVAWTWDAGSSTVANTAGSITSQVRANASAGFSVATFTFPSSGSFTVGHGLGVAPSLIIIKHRTRSGEWLVYHASVTSKDQYLVLNSTAAVASAGSAWGASAPTSTVFGTTTGVGGISGDQDVAYCFAPVAGYSSFGSYTGNGSATDGPFVFTGFRPRWVMIKGSSFAGESWFIWDTSRNTYNQMGARLLANESPADNSNQVFGDILSNGFKLRNTWGGINGSGNTYIYACFAEHPLQSSRAR
jgi:hypothetical protein